MRWIRTEGGKLVNLAHMSEVDIVAELAKVDGDTVRQFVLCAYEPSYTHDPCRCELMRFDSRKEADQALTDLYDWLAEEPVGCDFTAYAKVSPDIVARAEADTEAAAINRLTGHDPHQCVKCRAMDCVCRKGGA